VSDDSFFLASAMQEYAETEGLDAEGLAVALGCGREQLGPLGLCRRPHGDTFVADVRQIAGRFGIAEERVATVVRRADVLATMRTAGESDELISAARDREEDDAP
jgi:hypothetical protein